jgi:hypothetical protein
MAGCLQVIDFMERETGVEPATSSLGSWHSTTELLPPGEGDLLDSIGSHGDQGRQHLPALGTALDATTTS